MNLQSRIAARLGLPPTLTPREFRSSPSLLAGKLGMGALDRAAILNCDDLGSSHAANVGILEAMQRGFATSATLMVPCPFAEEAAQMFRGMDVGVHLTLTSEFPRYRWRSLTRAASLEESDGALPRRASEVHARADLEDVRRECRAQIDQALQWGVDVTHLDSHMFTMQSDPRFCDIYFELGAEYQLPVRMCEFDADARRGLAQRGAAARLDLQHPDEFAFEWGYPLEKLLRRFLPQLGPGVTEFALHPAVDGPELRRYDNKTARVRIGDHACAVKAELAALFEAEGIARISFRPLRDLQRT